jgi:hypothetical protein
MDQRDAVLGVGVPAGHAEPGRLERATGDQRYRLQCHGVHVNGHFGGRNSRARGETPTPVGHGLMESALLVDRDVNLVAHGRRPTDTPSASFMPLG